MRASFNIFDFSMELESEVSNHYVFKKYDGNDKILFIPEQLMGTPITTISSGAFKGNVDTKVIILSSNLKNIAIDAFGNKQIIIYTPFDKDEVNWDFGFSNNVTIRYGLVSIKTINDVDYALFSDNSAIIFNHNLDYRRFENYGRFGESLELETVIDEQYVVEGIEDFAFQNAINLKRLAFPKQLKWIGNHSFINCEMLESVSLPDEIVEIKDFSFAHCLNLLSFEAPKSLEKMGHSVLSETYKPMILLESSDQDAKWDSDWNPEKCPIARGFESFTIRNNIVYALLRDKRATVVNNSLDEITDVEIPEHIENDNVLYTVSEIGPFSFFESKFLRSIKLPESIKMIYGSAFADSNLVSISLPPHLEYLGDAVFSNNIFLHELHLPDNTTEVPMGLCNQCISLKKVVMGNKVKIIRKYAFSGCGNLIDAEIPISVEIIETMAFYGTNLSSVALGYNIKEIHELVFGCVDNLSTLVILNQNAIIGDHIVTNYADVTIYLGGSDDSIVEKKIRNDALVKPKIYTEVYKFLEVEGIKYLLNEYNSARVFGYSEDRISEEARILGDLSGCVVTHIEKKAFSKAQKIKKITIPKSIVKIGEYFAEDCINLRQIVLPSHLNYIEASWLKGTSNVQINIWSELKTNDPLKIIYDEILKYVLDKQYIDINEIQDKFEIGYKKAMKIVDRLKIETSLIIAHHEE